MELYNQKETEGEIYRITGKVQELPVKGFKIYTDEGDPPKPLLVVSTVGSRYHIAEMKVFPEEIRESKEDLLEHFLCIPPVLCDYFYRSDLFNMDYGDVIGITHSDEYATAWEEAVEKGETSLNYYDWVKQNSWGSSASESSDPVDPKLDY
jgi:hypothetical protein